MKTPNPGSDAAIKAGCACPVADNARGEGVVADKDGVPLFWMNAACPIHAKGVSYLGKCGGKRKK